MKKLLFLTIIALLLVSCSTEPSIEVENKAGTVSENILLNSDFENGNKTDVHANGCSTGIISGAGIGGSKALMVIPEDNWGEVEINISNHYGRGKSYYVEASLKNYESTGENLVIGISYQVVSGAVASKYGDDYNTCSDIKGGQLLSTADGKAIFNHDTNPSAVLGSAYVTVSAIIPATEIDRILAETTEKYGSGDPTLSRLYVNIFVGGETERNNYSYYVDNVVIKDLNSELPVQ